MADKAKPNLSDIKLLVLDVDGVLTDGSIIVNADGSESKAFSTLDGHGIRMAKRAGLKVALLSGRSCLPVEHRAKQLNIDHCLQDCHDKLPALKDLLAKMGLQPDEVAFVGDDLPDLPVIRYVGFAAAVANADEKVKEKAHFVTDRKGGSGAVREVIDYILKETGLWPQVTQKYFS
jgi:3-deoxy-D-manno-octulosonate 8-phosphate phosphatase (KDO 8-P phosphatase)